MAGCQPARQRPFDDRIAVGDVPRHDDVEQPDERETGEQHERARPGTPARAGGDRVEEPDVADRQEADHHPEDAVRETLPVGVQLERRHGEHGLVPEQAARRHDGRRGGDDDQAEVRQMHLAEQHDLLREQEATERSIERRCDARARTAGDQHLPLLGGEPGETGDRRADRAADLRDRSFASHRGAGAERDGRAERLHDHPAPLHAGAMEMEHLEEAREPVAEHLPRKQPIEREQHEPAADERERDADPAEWRDAALEEPGRTEDRVAEDDVSHRAEDAGQNREGDEPRIAALVLDDAPQAERRLHTR